jgi:hypothetical protein
VCCVLFERGVLLCVIRAFVCCVSLWYHCQLAKTINNSDNNAMSVVSLVVPRVYPVFNV